MDRVTGLCLILFSITAMLPLTSTENNYRLTVEQPVTVVTNSQVSRENGTCCGPSNNCTTCPDDPSVEVEVFVCFRQGNVEGFGTNISYCPLGGMEFTPNQAPGETVELEARPEADSLPAEYQGSLQLLTRITTTLGNDTTPLDDALVLNSEIPADGIFRRISSLSTLEVALIGVNVKVECVNGTVMPDCSVPLPTTTLPTTAEEEEGTTELVTMIETSTELVTSTSEGTNTEGTTTQANTPGEGAQSSTISGVSIVIGLCIGLVVAAVLTAFLCGTLLCYTNRKHRIAAMKAISKDTGGLTLASNPTTTLGDDQSHDRGSPNLPTTFL